MKGLRGDDHRQRPDNTARVSRAAINHRRPTLVILTVVIVTDALLERCNGHLGGCLDGGSSGLTWSGVTGVWLMTGSQQAQTDLLRRRSLLRRRTHTSDHRRARNRQRRRQRRRIRDLSGVPLQLPRCPRPCLERRCTRWTHTHTHARADRWVETAAPGGDKIVEIKKN